MGTIKTPDQSGETTRCRIFGGKTCQQVPTDEVRAGDYIEFNRRGLRVRLVDTVHRGRKHNYVQFVPSKYNPFKNQRVNLKEVKSVWRQQGAAHERSGAEAGS